jgi:hypothetical protein
MSEIAKALATAQRNMGKALKQADNPHFRSKYADLGAVMDACLPALNEAGIAVIQPLQESEFGRSVKTVFLHTSGETLETSVPLITAKNDMQGLGSAITYARRYGLMTLAGIAPEDDDGNAAVAGVKKTNGMTEAIGDAWRDGVLDKLPENATDAMKAEAFADAICDGLKGKKQKALDNEWQRRSKLIDSLAQRFPELHARVVVAYEQQQEANDMEAA